MHRFGMTALKGWVVTSALYALSHIRVLLLLALAKRYLLAQVLFIKTGYALASGSGFLSFTVLMGSAKIDFDLLLLAFFQRYFRAELKFNYKFAPHPQSSHCS